MHSECNQSLANECLAISFSSKVSVCNPSSDAQTVLYVLLLFALHTIIIYSMYCSFYDVFCTFVMLYEEHTCMKVQSNQVRMKPDQCIRSKRTRTAANRPDVKCSRSASSQTLYSISEIFKRLMIQNVPRQDLMWKRFIQYTYSYFKRYTRPSVQVPMVTRKG